MNNPLKRLASLGLGIALCYIEYLLATYFWNLAVTPLAVQTLLGIFLCILSFLGIIFFGMLCIGSLGYAILGD